ncbi:molybdenum cofactor guanylyltransferase [Gaoshiqia sp. Z1-71]|uniref:molybdenum cofactor guanylyltransferase n=1 Tax=Gaoshiqia hydrogeniformans TaxID=3290090 RepID=UPI003BF8DFEF
MNEITGIILAGGKSSRMGTDKALISFNGKKLIEYSISVMREICQHILISANNPGYRDFGYPVVFDHFVEIGPLAGLEAGLRHSKSRINLVVPCDTPFLSAYLFKDILSHSPFHDAVVPVQKNGKIEPLTAYYSKKIQPALIRQINQGDYKMQNLLKLVNTKYIILNDNNLLNNLNTPGDLAALTQ